MFCGSAVIIVLLHYCLSELQCMGFVSMATYVLILKMTFFISVKIKIIYHCTSSGLFAYYSAATGYLIFMYI